jgi:hypothetical protein
VRLASSLIGATTPVLQVAVGSTNGLNIAEADKPRVMTDERGVPRIVNVVDTLSR